MIITDKELARLKLAQALLSGNVDEKDITEAWTLLCRVIADAEQQG